MNKIIGRLREISLLEKTLKSSNAELLAVYGRRRIGKTFLVSNFFSNKGLYLEMTGIQKGSIQLQLKAFVQCLKKTFPRLQIEKIPKDWFEAFNLLKNAIETTTYSNKIILFFDEFPWMDTRKSDLLKSFEYYWNSFLSKDSRVITILCGSSVSWMIKKIIRNKGGLYGRLTGKVRLRPFTLSETEDFLLSKHIHLDRKQIVEVYMAIGGVPKYLNFITPGKSSAQIIQELCFDNASPLSTEFEELYESLFDNHQNHLKVMNLLSKHKVGLTFSQITKYANKIPGGSLSKTLKELIASDFVQLIPFFGKKQREAKYRLSDEYSFFYLNWVQDALYNYDQSLSSNYWIKQQSSSKFKSWSGYIFETICIKHIREIIEALRLDVVAENIAYWSYLPNGKEGEKGAQIDLIIDRSDQCMNLCEIKFHQAEYIMNEDTAKKLNNRREIFREISKTKKTLFNTVISPYGAKENRHYFSSVDNQLILDKLFDKKS